MSERKPAQPHQGRLADLFDFAGSRTGILLLSLIFTLALLYHWILPLNSVPYSDRIFGQDCYQMIWNLWVVNEAVIHGENPFTTDLVFHPQGARLVHHSLSAGFVVVTLPVWFLSRGDPLYPVYAYKIIILISFTLILHFSVLTLRALGFRGWATVIPAIAYAFSPFYLEHLIHLNQISGFFIPLSALCVINSYQRPRSR